MNNSSAKMFGEMYRDRIRKLGLSLEGYYGEELIEEDGTTEDSLDIGIEDIDDTDEDLVYTDEDVNDNDEGLVYTNEDINNLEEEVYSITDPLYVEPSIVDSTEDIHGIAEEEKIKSLYDVEEEVIGGIYDEDPNDLASLFEDEDNVNYEESEEDVSDSPEWF